MTGRINLEELNGPQVAAQANRLVGRTGPRYGTVQAPPATTAATVPSGEAEAPAVAPSDEVKQEVEAAADEVIEEKLPDPKVANTKGGKAKAKDESKGDETRPSTVSLIRVGTRGTDYFRKDKVSTIRFNFISSKELYQREREFSAKLKFPWTRNKWLEKVVSDAIDAWEAEEAKQKQEKKRA